jgi:hypothetical protein
VNCRKFFPREVTTAKLTKGQTISKRNGNVVVMKWKDKRDVLAVSTRHTGKIVTLPRLNRRGAQVNKQDLILDYNQHMGGVDRVDQILSYYSPLRKSIKWYRKVVFHIFDLCIGNAYHIYKHLGGRNPQLWFRKQVIRGLVSAVPPPVQGPQKRPLAHHKWSDPSRLVVGQGHFIVQIPREGHAKATPMRQCVLCTKNKRRKETRYQCETCDSTPALCLGCFKDFHTKIVL